MKMTVIVDHFYLDKQTKNTQALRKRGRGNQRKRKTIFETYYKIFTMMKMTVMVDHFYLFSL